jgi:hypothetical protein
MAWAMEVPMHGLCYTAKKHRNSSVFRTSRRVMGSPEVGTAAPPDCSISFAASYRKPSQNMKSHCFSWPRKWLHRAGSRGSRDRNDNGLFGSLRLTGHRTRERFAGITAQELEATSYAPKAATPARTHLESAVTILVLNPFR